MAMTKPTLLIIFPLAFSLTLGTKPSEIFTVSLFSTLQKGFQTVQFFHSLGVWLNCVFYENIALYVLFR